MAAIESGPLPPPGFGGQITKITEADRAEIMAQANKVIDFLLNGPGSFTVDGPRKPVVDDPGFDSMVQDLKNFRNSVVAAKQFADDPNHILDSVVELINDTVGRIQRAVRDQAITGPDVKDSISNPPPDTVDRLNNARVPVPLPAPDVPQDPSNGSPGGVQPIMLSVPPSNMPLYPMQTIPDGTTNPVAPESLPDLRTRQNSR